MNTAWVLQQSNNTEYMGRRGVDETGDKDHGVNLKSEVVQKHVIEDESLKESI